MPPEDDSDVNIEKLLQENINAFQRLFQEFNLHERVTYSHLEFGI